MKPLLKALLVVLGLIMAFLPPVASAADIIQEIRIEGNARIERDAIMAQIESQEGEYYSLSKIDRDLRALYLMGYFRDVSFDMIEGDSGKILTIRIVEKPTVKEYFLEGNKKLDHDKLLEVMDLAPNRILSASKIKANIAKIKKLYSDEGYFMADVDYVVGPEKDNIVTVTIRIREYKKVLIKSINFVGNSAFTDDKLRKIMRTKEGTLWSRIASSGVYKQDEFEADISMLNNFYRDKGYADIQIDPPLVALTPDKRWMFITLRISEGPEYKVGEVDIEGELLFDKGDLFKKLILRTGDVFSYSKFLGDIETLKNTYTDIGYAFASVTPRTPRNPETKIVNITYVVEKGNLAYIERIDIQGNERSRDKVIRRELLIREGELFSGPGIRKSKEYLMRLGYFDDVTITTERGSSEERVNLLIEVKERRVGNFIIGVGFSSLENFIGTAQVTHTDLWGLGHRINLTAEIGQYRKNIDLSYVEPYLLDTKIIAGISLLNQDRDYRSFSRLDKAARLRLGYPLGWDVRGFISYGFADTEIKDVAADSPIFLSLQRGRISITSLIFSLDRSTVNNPNDPSRGSRNSVSLEWASQNFGGDINFLKYQATTRWYFDLLGEKLIGRLFDKPITTAWRPVIMLNGEMGYAQSLDNERLPLSERFFLGGLNSVRGFRTRGLGPEDSSIIASDPSDPASGLTTVTSRIGGNKFLQGNIEFIFPIIPTVGVKGLFFFDVGNAFDDDENYQLGKFRQSWGFGFRWMSPIGPLRFEWGFPLHPQGDEESQVFEFGMGTFF